SHSLQHCEFSGPLAHRDSHGVAGNQQKSEEDNAANRHDKELDVAELFYPPGSECFLRVSVRLKGRVGKLCIDRFGNAQRIIRVVKFYRVPAHLSFQTLGHLFFHALPLEPELGFIISLASAVIDAVKIEFPNAAKECSLDGDAVAHLPAKTLGRGGARDGPLPVIYKVLPLLFRNGKLGIDLALAVHV